MSKPRTVMETAATLLVTAAALVVASVYVHGQLAGGSGSRGEVVEGSEIENWQEDTALGIRVGPADARMVVTEFMDFTCPFCAMVVPAVDSLLSHYPTDAALVFQHFPLGRPLSLPGRGGRMCRSAGQVRADVPAPLCGTAVAWEQGVGDLRGGGRDPGPRSLQ